MTDADAPLDRLIRSIDRLLAEAPAGDPPLDGIAAELAVLVADDGWLAAAQRLPDPDRYRRIRLYEDAEGRFSVGCFVWAPGQTSAIHDHCSWGVVAVLDGPMRAEGFRHDDAGVLRPAGALAWLPSRTIAFADPRIGDIHRLGAPADRASISIHVYGCRFDAVNRNLYDEPPAA